MKKSQLQELVKEAIQEILGENLKQDARQKKLAAIDAEIKALQGDKVNITTGKDEIGEARGPIKFKLADDYENKVSELPYNNSEKRMKWVNGIIDYVEENGAKDITTIAREKFNVPQPRIADYARDMIRLGILVPETEGTVPQFMRPEDEDGEEEPGGVEDMFVGNKENPLSMYFDDEAPSPEEEPEMPAQSSSTSTPSMSDEDREAFMDYTDLETRLARIKSDIRKKTGTNTPGDIKDTSKGLDVQNLIRIKDDIQKKMKDLLANSEYLRKRQAKMANKAEPLDEWTKSKLQYYAGIKK